MKKDNEQIKDPYNYRRADPFKEGIYNCGNCRRQGNSCPVQWNKRNNAILMTCDLHKLDISKLD